MANTYFDKLSAEQKKNIAIIVKKMKEKGITNKLTQSAILAVVSKESAFIPKGETSYKNTSNDRIRSIFSKTKGLSDSQLTALKANEKAFFDFTNENGIVPVYDYMLTDEFSNFVYGGKFGNEADEGYKYRGRGFNQLTFKGNYKSIGSRIGRDLVNNPDQVNNPEIAAEVLIDFFLREFNNAKTKGVLGRYNTTDINGFKNQNDSLNAVFDANRGWKTGTDSTGGFKKASERVAGFSEIIGDTIVKTTKKLLPLYLGILALTGIGLTIYFLSKKK